MKKRRLLWSGLGLASILLLVGATMAATGFSNSDERADCPGKVTCPLTGEQVCKDQCPLTDANRSDCPGKIECSITGKMVCKDQCPLAENADVTESGKELPACCRGK